MKAIVLLLLAVVPVAAQKPKPTATVKGTVTDGTGPVGQATVEIFGTRLSRITGDNGSFQFDSLKPGPYWIKVRRIGFAPLTFTATLIAGDTRDLHVELEAAAFQLPDYIVEGRMTDRRFNEFRWRKATAWGKFYTRDDIARIRPIDLIDLVRRGLPYSSRSTLEWGNPGSSVDRGSVWTAGWHTRSPRFGPCAPAVYFNGGPGGGYLLSDFELDEVEAVEVYRGNHVPIELGRNWGGDACGLVVVWLK